METSAGEDAVTDRPSGRLQCAARTIDATRPWALLDTDRRPRWYWSGPDGETVVGLGAAATVTVDVAANDRYTAVERSAAALFADATFDDVPPRARPRFFGGFAFHDHHDTAGPWADFPTARFVLPAVQLVQTGDEAWLTRSATDGTLPAFDRVLGEDSPPEPAGLPNGPGVDARDWRPDRSIWCDGVRRGLDRIESGDVEKLVLAGTLDLELENEASPVTIVRRLAAAHPSCHQFCFQPTDGAAFVGATPERLAAFEGRRLQTEALAGSTGRGETADEDEWLASDLASSEKDGHEHTLAVEAIQDRLEPLAASVSVGPRTVQRLSSVQHLRTPIRATLSNDRHVLDVVSALHPTPAVGGLPTDAALDAIDAIEPFDRGWYAGPVGWFDAAGDGTFAVGIRSALVRERSATCYAGAGIVADSDPDDEWDEVQLKYRPLLDALDG